MRSAVFSVRSAESPNGGAHIPGASKDGERIAHAAMAASTATTTTKETVMNTEQDHIADEFERRRKEDVGKAKPAWVMALDFAQELLVTAGKTGYRETDDSGVSDTTGIDALVKQAYAWMDLATLYRNHAHTSAQATRLAQQA